MDGVAVEVGGSRLRTLLTRLALDPGRTVGANALVEALWGDAPPAEPGNALQSLVSRLRRAVPGLPLQSAPGGYRLDLPADAVDAHRFERLAREGARALRADNPAGAATVLSEALALWRGPALADVAGADFAAAADARLSELRLAATEDRVEAQLRLGADAALLGAELGGLAAAHPLRERTWALRMRALAAAGRTAGALAAYEEVRARLADTFGADPSAELREAHLAVLRGSAAPHPATPAAPPPQIGNLRATVSSFVGREAELARLGALLGEQRLVTLVGPGGAGKTRLAGTAAAAAAPRLPGGAWLVELAPVSDPADVPQAALATVLRREARVRDPNEPSTPADDLSRLADALRGADTLLVLDNCEHVIDAAARLADELLARCPQLRVLATSREPLGIVGESLAAVPSLRLPAPDCPAAEAARYPSVQLLRDRASAVRPGFDVDDGNVAAVVEICRRLDGLPLAIELAAARLRTQSPEEVARRLDDRFRLLTGGSRTAMPRHRTLRAVVAWSWDLLTDDERHLVETLAVFPATITADSAAGVAGLDTPVALDLLGAVVDKSLLQVIDGAGDTTRYRMLETIREYGVDRLAEAGTLEAARAAHAAHFLSLAETAEPHLRGADQLPWLALMRAEWDNLVGAIHTACDAGDADTALRMCSALTFLWMMTGSHEQAGALLSRALAVPGDAPAQARAIAAMMHQLHNTMSGIARPDLSRVGEVVALLDGVDLHRAHPLLALVRPALSLVTDDTEAGLAEIDRQLDHPDPWARAMLLTMRSSIQENAGYADGMMRDVTAAVEAFRQVGDRWGMSTALTVLADAKSKRGETDEAAAALEESIRLMRELNPGDDAGHQRIWLASVHAYADPERARAELRAYVAEFPEPSPRRETAFALLILADLARTAGEPAEARQMLDRARVHLDAANLVPPQFQSLLLSTEAHLAMFLGRDDDAAEHISAALRYAVEGNDMPVVAKVGVAAACHYGATGEPALAAEALGAADAVRGTRDLTDCDTERLTRSLRQALGDAAFEAAYAKGRGHDRAGAFALFDPVGPAPTGSN
ncbi:BTAD domain-containing putative transcriptional regulator [Luedemannella helvata]|uniref:BTAD domain-containing putative transcriptional regulator n=1 Tax=Luedemannella helvata TaxID=349315 RepID=A0ABN2KH58_9ACTN